MSFSWQKVHMLAKSAYAIHRSQAVMMSAFPRAWQKSMVLPPLWRFYTSIFVSSHESSLPCQTASKSREQLAEWYLTPPDTQWTWQERMWKETEGKMPTARQSWRGGCIHDITAICWLTKTWCIRTTPEDMPTCMGKFYKVLPLMQRDRQTKAAERRRNSLIRGWTSW